MNNGTESFKFMYEKLVYFLHTFGSPFNFHNNVVLLPCLAILHKRFHFILFYSLFITLCLIECGHITSKSLVACNATV